jgi:hypothetical protein
MKTLFHPFLLFITLLYVNLTYAQTTFSVSDTVQNVYKNTTFGTIHGYTQLTNLTQNNLQLRWRLTITGKYPPSWIFSAADPDSAYSPVYSGDSADFTLDLVSTTTNKIIYGLDHKGEPGSAQMSFFIFDPSNPTENVTVNFNLFILDATGINQSLTKNPNIKIDNNYIYILNSTKIKQLQIINLNGSVTNLQNFENSKKIKLPDNNTLYFIEIIYTDNKKEIYKIINQQ